MVKLKKDRKKIVTASLDNKVDDGSLEETTAGIHSDRVVVKPFTDIITKEKPKSKIKYTISGLSDALKKEALKMLEDGASVQQVAAKYGIAPSDIAR